MNQPGKRDTVILALSLWAAWTAATYLLEGRILTLLRPEAAGARILYAVVANLGIGIVGAGLVLRYLSRSGGISLRRAGFGPLRRSVVAILIGSGLGFAAYVAQGAPSLHPVVLLNGFAQVLVVSIAEVLVCWAAVAVAFEAVLRPRLGRWGLPPAALGAAVLFGAYHYAHSPPFNTPAMVTLLSFVGLITGAFFFVSRDIYGTIVFHNFLGLFGVLGVLEKAGRLDTYASIQSVLLGSAALGVVVLLMLHRLWLRPSPGSHGGAQARAVVAATPQSTDPASPERSATPDATARDHR